MFAQTYADFQLIVVDDALRTTHRRYWENSRTTALLFYGIPAEAEPLIPETELLKRQKESMWRSDADISGIVINFRYKCVFWRKQKAAAIGTYAYETDSGEQPVKFHASTEPENK